MLSAGVNDFLSAKEAIQNNRLVDWSNSRKNTNDREGGNDHSVPIFILEILSLKY